MKVINDYILIEKLSEERKTEHGILLSGHDAKDMRYRKGKVLSSGNLNEGDTIYYDKTRSFALIVEGKEVTVIRMADVVVVL